MEKRSVDWEKRLTTKDPSIYVPSEDTLIPAITLIRRKWKGASFFMGFQDGFIEIAKNRKLGLEAVRVLFFLLGQIEYENLLVVSQIEIARELGMKKQNVSRAIKLLITEKVLEIKDPHRKRRQRFSLNGEYAWKGSLKSFSSKRKGQAKKPQSNPRSLGTAKKGKSPQISNNSDSEDHPTSKPKPEALEVE
jgi:DNA-binding MarR family transcriptional regulator